MEDLTTTLDKLCEQVAFREAVSAQKLTFY